uniref:Uncharacterized protein n=1 Tax=viral metagenome TaxID=1070528 RepID=A0A6M3IMC5_9ZZZZ
MKGIKFINDFGITTSTVSDNDLNKKWSLGGNPSTEVVLFGNAERYYKIGQWVNPLTGIVDNDAFTILAKSEFEVK